MAHWEMSWNKALNITEQLSLSVLFFLLFSLLFPNVLHRFFSYYYCYDESRYCYLLFSHFASFTYSRTTYTIVSLVSYRTVKMIALELYSLYSFVINKWMCERSRISGCTVSIVWTEHLMHANADQFQSHRNSNCMCRLKNGRTHAT